MIQVGDLVRIKNRHLRPSNIFSCMTRRGRSFKKYRGRQIISRVIRLVHRGGFDRSGKWTGAVYELDTPGRFAFGRNILNEHWLQLHRKNRRRERAMETSQRGDKAHQALPRHGASVSNGAEPNIPPPLISGGMGGVQK